MKIKIGLIIVVTFLCIDVFSQNNQATINFNLSKSLREQVGGDLVIPDNNVCVANSKTFQKLFESTTATTVYFDINNRGGGNSCVTLVVETANGTINTVIPEDAQSGVLRCNRVRRAYLTIINRPREITVQVATSIGTATVWF